MVAGRICSGYSRTVEMKHHVHYIVLVKPTLLTDTRL